MKVSPNSLFLDVTRLFSVQFKNDMAKDISQMVARHSVQQILAGLEGAVITSVPGTSGLGPTLPQRPQHGRHDSMDSDASSGTGALSCMSIVDIPLNQILL